MVLLNLITCNRVFRSSERFLIHFMFKLKIDLLQNSVKDGKVRKRGMRSEGK
ncbi:hypothetical protein [Candidatus Wolbachia massiliensis]|uniref:hypothetical protein n=1 Tax=Candidatus Wolbachia massiliensis TaxID=1845000 RepID=UPI001CD11B6D|nr:hypothetical protein [Candidatus Wolbachia massiliensis]